MEETRKKKKNNFPRWVEVRGGHRQHLVFQVCVTYMQRRIWSKKIIRYVWVIKWDKVKSDSIFLGHFSQAILPLVFIITPSEEWVTDFTLNSRIFLLIVGCYTRCNYIWYFMFHFNTMRRILGQQRKAQVFR